MPNVNPEPLCYSEIVGVYRQARDALLDEAVRRFYPGADWIEFDSEAEYNDEGGYDSYIVSVEARSAGKHGAALEPVDPDGETESEDELEDMLMDYARDLPFGRDSDYTFDLTKPPLKMPRVYAEVPVAAAT